MRRAAAVAAALLLGGCDLELERDARLRFLAPPDGARIELPALIEWRLDGAKKGQVYGVFVDRSPMRPGKPVSALAERDRLCAVSPGCPDRDWLADHGVYLTRRTAIALPALPRNGGRPAGRRRRHRVTIVLLDGRGVRVGEGAWTRVVYAPEASG